MTDKIKQIADAKRKRGWSRSEIEAYAKRKSAEYKKISEKNPEPDYLASGTQKPIEKVCSEDDEHDK